MRRSKRITRRLLENVYLKLKGSKKKTSPTIGRTYNSINSISQLVSLDESPFLESIHLEKKTFSTETTNGRELTRTWKENFRWLSLAARY